MRTIVTAITAAALALSLTFQAGVANAAVAGYDSSYAGESAFLSLDQGDEGSFTVFFANTGTTTWTTGSATQVDLAACLEDKVTCNQQDTDEATFNDGWLSATRYATHTQTSVAPGQIGTFTYNVTVPADAAEDTFRFNGALVLASTGADIHNEGYFQDVTTGTPPTEGAATLTELDPEEGDIEGGDTVTITGEDFDCTPSFPTVLFGDNEADVESCGAETLTVTTPAGDAEGDVDVTVTNAGAGASNALTFTYEDVTGPDYDSVSVAGQIATLTFSEPVCVDGGSLVDDTDIDVIVNGTTLLAADYSNSFTDCDDDETDAEATVTITNTTTYPIAEGDTVTVRINNSGADKVEDAAGNFMDTATTRSTEAAADTSRPTAVSAAVTAANTIRVTFSEPVFCPEGEVEESFTFDETGTPAEQGATDSDCGDGGEDDTAAGADTTITLTGFTGVAQGDDGVLEYVRTTTRDITDLSGNTVADFDIDVTALEADPPLIDDAALTGSAGLANTADSGDEITLTFSESMAAIASGDTIRVQDEDGTIADITCTGAVAANDDLTADCVLDGDELTITLQESTDISDTTDPTDDNLVAAGDVQGLQWPATIIDTSGITDAEGNDPDLGDSDDVVIDDE